MAQIKEIKKRIRSVESTKQVTHAMELISAAKMRKSQNTAIASRPYSISLSEMLLEIKSKHLSAKHRLLKDSKSPNHLIILIASDRGLAGGLNINIFREIIRLASASLKSSDEPVIDFKNTQFITVGKKASEFVARGNHQLIASYHTEEKEPYELARIISKMAIDSYINHEIGKVTVFYPHFETTVKQPPKWITVLPLKLPSAALSQEEKNRVSELLFEPNPDEILEQILPHYILTQIYQVLVEAKAAEHSARMVAMKNATDAAGDLIDNLTLTYNQARQESITKELLDITTAQRAFE